MLGCYHFSTVSIIIVKEGGKVYRNVESDEDTPCLPDSAVSKSRGSYVED